MRLRSFEKHVAAGMLRQMSMGAVLVYKIHRASTYVAIIFCAF